MGKDSQADDRRFPSTRWSLVAEAAGTNPEVKRQALEALLPKYLSALTSHVRYRWGMAHDRADDLVQEFVASVILEKGLIATANQQRGKLRTLLLTALDRFVINQLRDQAAKKRAPQKGRVLPLDERLAPQDVVAEPSLAFDVEWAKAVLAEALRQMREECKAKDRMDVWDLFECRVVGPLLHGAPVPNYREIVRRLGFQSPSQASNALITGKRMYARVLKSVVAHYVGDSDFSSESEIRGLRAALARHGG
jgi:DNA-directed RNA polymerase specialized sigma24 family protein